jgi:hypothetical protein
MITFVYTNNMKNHSIVLYVNFKDLNYPKNPLFNQSKFKFQNFVTLYITKNRNKISCFHLIKLFNYSMVLKLSLLF